MFRIVLCIRLLQHAAALRQLTHRNIAAVYDAFSAENCMSDGGADPTEQTSSFSVYIVQVPMQFIHRSFLNVVDCRIRSLRTVQQNLVDLPLLLSDFVFVFPFFLE